MSNLNQLEYHIVSDGTMLTDGGGAFGLVARPVWMKRLPPDEQNRVPFAINCLLLRSEGKTIVVDTGCGRKLNAEAMTAMGLQRPDGDLVDGLARLGVAPHEVDIVVNTHLHFDHCAGNTYKEDGQLKPTFPNAEYWVQRLEFADAIAPNERTRNTYYAENFMPLYQAGQLRLLDGNTRVTAHVRTAVTRGHTRAHQVVILESGRETALFMADLSTLHYHFERLQWVASYDLEPMESIETKRYWQQWAIAHDATLIFQHDTQIPIGKLQPDGRNFKVVRSPNL